MQVRKPTSIAVVFFILTVLALAIAALLSGCAGEREQQAQAAYDQKKVQVDQQTKNNVAQATANLETVGAHLSATDRPYEGDAVRTEAILINHALSISAQDQPPPTVTFAEWQAAKDDATASRSLAMRLRGEKDTLTTQLSTLRGELDHTKAELDDAKKKGVWGWLATVGIVAGGAGLWVARLAGIPGVNLLYDPLVRLIGGPVVRPLEAKAEAFGQRAQVAATAVMASDVARFGLAALQSKLRSAHPDVADKLSQTISSMTNSRASTPEELFKLLAKGVAVDEGRQAEVDALLNEVRASTPTKLGVPVAVADMVSGRPA